MIYTPNYNDIPEVFRILLAIKSYFEYYRYISLSFKANEATIVGKYATDARAIANGFNKATELKDNEFICMLYEIEYSWYRITSVMITIVMLLHLLTIL